MYNVCLQLFFGFVTGPANNFYIINIIDCISFTSIIDVPIPHYPFMKSPLFQPLSPKASLDLPDDKKSVVLNSSEEKKRLMVRDHNRRQTHHQFPPKFYISKFAHVLEAENIKVIR